MKKILVPVDFSEYSEYALKVAANLAKQHNAEIIALHMMGISDAVLSKNQSKQMLEGIYFMKLAEKRFAEFLDKDYLKGINVTDTVYNYKNFSELNAVALENEADIIIMGSHGSSGLSEVFVGSNTEKVVRNSDIPVLVVKHEMDEFKINNAVLACEFASENVKAYHKAMNFFKALDAEVKLLYVNLPGQNYGSTNEMIERVHKFLLEADGNLNQVENVVYYNDYSVEDGIFNYSNYAGIDMIALPTHGRRGLSHFFSGSISEDLVNHSKIPVVTFKI
ncbi:MAG: universal stress protein [Flavobacteriaceae bacterium]|nr:universal stress protein [Flavobacteriaceae bacterium]